jgi:hypothetical protein
MSDYSSETPARVPAHLAPAQSLQPGPSEEFRRLAFHEVETRRLLSIVGLLAMGVLILFVAHYYLNDPPLLHDLSRDIGLAFVIASLGAALYETYARKHFELKLLTSFLDAVMGDWSHPDIWSVVKAQVIEKDVMREKLRIGLEIERDDRVGQGQMLCRICVNYALHGLKTSRERVCIRHFLDMHLQVPQHNLPRFTGISIDGEPEIKLAPPDVSSDGKFTRYIDIPARGRGGKVVASDREEVIYVPGNHCFTMTEITRGIELFIDKIPDDVRICFTIRPANVENVELKRGMTGSFKDENLLLLPGQNIEFFFKYRDGQECQVKTPASSADGT